MKNRADNSHSAKSGYSFIEVLVAIAILLIAIVGPLTIASSGIRNANLAREQTIAVMLAQEGLEGVYFFQAEAGLERLNNDNYNTWQWVSANLPGSCRNGGACLFDITKDPINYESCRGDTGCGVYFNGDDGNRYPYRQIDNNGGGGTATPYTRQIYFDEISRDTLKVRSVVSWESNATSDTHSVELVTYLSDIYDN